MRKYYDSEKSESSILIGTNNYYTFNQKKIFKGILYMHEDSILICVLNTNAKTFLEAEADVFVDNYRELPKEILKEKTEQLLILKPKASRKINKIKAHFISMEIYDNCVYKYF